MAYCCTASSSAIEQYGNRLKNFLVLLERKICKWLLLTRFRNQLSSLNNESSNKWRQDCRLYPVLSSSIILRYTVSSHFVLRRNFNLTLFQIISDLCQKYSESGQNYSEVPFSWLIEVLLAWIRKVPHPTWPQLSKLTASWTDYPCIAVQSASTRAHLTCYET